MELQAKMGFVHIYLVDGNLIVYSKVCIGFVCGYLSLRGSHACVFVSVQDCVLYLEGFELYCMVVRCL